LQHRLGGKTLSPPLIHDLVARLGGSPLAAELAGRLVRERVASGAREDQALESLVRALDAKGLAAIDRGTGSAALTSAIDATMEMLQPSERERLVELAAFPEDAPIPLKRFVASGHWMNLTLKIWRNGCVTYQSWTSTWASETFACTQCSEACCAPPHQTWTSLTCAFRVF